MTAPDGADVLLDVNDVTAGYGATTVLNGLSLQVATGEVVGLIGRNGVGKTTTLRTIMGNLTPQSGRITFDGTDITALSPEETVAAGLAHVPEERRVFESLSVRENLELAALGGGNQSQSQETTAGGWDIDAALGAFENLQPAATAPASTLSGGEQQMLAIARALVSNARCLLLDEPTEGLAPTIIDQVVDTIATLTDRGLPVLLVEQNVPVALDLCDRIYVMDDGQVVYHDTAAAVAAADDVLDRYLGVSM